MGIGCVRPSDTRHAPRVLVIAKMQPIVTAHATTTSTTSTIIIITIAIVDNESCRCHAALWLASMTPIPAMSLLASLPCSVSVLLDHGPSDRLRRL